MFLPYGLGKTLTIVTNQPPISHPLSRHEVSGIPLRTLNRLEWLSLQLLSHDLYTSPLVWRQWLQFLDAYQWSRHAQTDCSNDGIPDAVVRFLLDHLCHTDPSLSREPLFLGLANRISQKIQVAPLPPTSASFELDQDGPLREEYIPRWTLQS